MTTDTTELERHLSYLTRDTDQALELFDVWEDVLLLAFDHAPDEYRRVFHEHIQDVAVEVSKPVFTGYNITDLVVNWDYIDAVIRQHPADGSEHPRSDDGSFTGSPVSVASTAIVVAAVGSERVENGVGFLPENAFEHLYDTARYGSDMAWEHAFPIGWYIDHPRIDVKTRLVDLATAHGEALFVAEAVQYALYANPGEAIVLIERLLEHEEFDAFDLSHPIEKAYRGYGDVLPVYTTPETKIPGAGRISDDTVERIQHVLREHVSENELVTWNGGRAHFPFTA